MIAVEIEAGDWRSTLSDVEERTRAAAAGALEYAGRTDGEVCVVLSSDPEVAELNQRFRGKAGPTNVLSFPAAKTARPHLGDVILAYETCAREAQAHGKPLEARLSHLVAHGVLHLLGWDHRTDAEADAMEAAERTVLGKLGISDPYAVEDDNHG